MPETLRTSLPLSSGVSRRRFLWHVGAAGLGGMAGTAWAQKPDDPLGPWRHGVTVRLVCGDARRHTIHTYYLTCPESPDGSRVLFYASRTPDAHHGELIVRDRATGEETVVASGLETEDAHRAACQQWTGGGRQVAWHDVKDGQWSVHVVDLKTREERTLAVDRQLGFGRALDDFLPLYGCHWNPGPHRDLELLDASTGKIRTVVEIGQVEKAYGTFVTGQFHGRPTSIFFPVLSPDGKRVFFKMAASGSDGAANKFRSKNASDRKGLVVFDLNAQKLLFMRTKWGHPAWHPDSRRIIEMGNVFLDADADGHLIRMPDLPKMPGNHPSVSPDGKLFVMDGLLDEVGGPKGHWGVVVCDVRGGAFQVLHRFNNARGAASWRKNHPHPVFSADGRRIYFNVNEGDWTQLHVAEAAP